MSSRGIDATRFCGHSARRGPGHLAAATVAEVYKQRWAIELFFKALKQSLRIKTFVGTSANALKTYIWAALIAMLLIKCFAAESRVGLVAVESGGAAAAAVVRLPRIVGLDRSSFSSAGAAPSFAAPSGDGLAVVGQQPISQGADLG